MLTILKILSPSVDRYSTAFEFDHFSKKLIAHLKQHKIVGDFFLIEIARFFQILQELEPNADLQFI